jgi:hypothetical protein
MINRVGKMCVAAMSLCMIVLIVTRKRGDKMFTFFCFFILVDQWASPNIPHTRCTHSEVELRKCCLGQSEKSKIPYHLINIYISLIYMIDEKKFKNFI